MKHATPSVKAQKRDRTGSRYAQRLRKGGRLPAVIYGHKTDPLAISVDENEILGHLRHGAHVMNLDIEGSGTETCLVKDLQYGHLGDNVVHLDFTRVNLEEEVTIHVHIAFFGAPAEAHRAGAILSHDHPEIAVRCKVHAIPEEIRVDLSRMTGMHLLASELDLPPGVHLAVDPATPIVTVSFLRTGAAVGEEAAVEGAAAEPEVITESKAGQGEGRES